MDVKCGQQALNRAIRDHRPCRVMHQHDPRRMHHQCLQPGLHTLLPRRPARYRWQMVKPHQRRVDGSSLPHWLDQHAGSGEPIRRVADHLTPGNGEELLGSLSAETTAAPGGNEQDGDGVWFGHGGAP